jgi:hypothetical protein
VPLHERHREQRGKNYLLLAILLGLIALVYVMAASKFVP